MRIVGLFVLLLLAVRPAEAQLSPVEPGSRIRVWNGSHVGPLEVVAADGTVVQARNATGETVVVDLAHATRIDVSQGPRSAGTAAVRGGMIGLLAGAGIGVIMGFGSGDDEPGIVAFTAEEKALVLGGMFGGAGAVIGGIAGALSPGEAWQRTSLPVDVQIRAAPSGTRLSLVRRL